MADSEHLRPDLESSGGERRQEGPDAVELDLSWVSALRESVTDEVEPREDEWPGFGAAVFARVDENDELGRPGDEALGASDRSWKVIAETLRADHAAAIADFEAQLDEFADGVALRWAEDADSSGPTLGDVMRAEVGDEMAGKKRVWSAFVHQVLAVIDRHQRRALAAGPEGIADGLGQALRDEVDVELNAVAHRFDGDFRDGIERKIFRAARRSPPWWWRPRSRPSSWLPPSTPAFARPAFGLAAAAIVALLWVVRPYPSSEPDAAAGTVSISAVRFGGSVTVMPDDGIAIVWVSEDDGSR